MRRNDWSDGEREGKFCSLSKLISNGTWHAKNEKFGMIQMMYKFFVQTKIRTEHFYMTKILCLTHTFTPFYHQIKWLVLHFFQLSAITDGRSCRRNSYKKFVSNQYSYKINYRNYLRLSVDQYLLLSLLLFCNLLCISVGTSNPYTCCLWSTYVLTFH